MQQELDWPVVQSPVLPTLPMRLGSMPAFVHPQQVQRLTDSSVTHDQAALVSGAILYQLPTATVFTSTF